MISYTIAQLVALTTGSYRPGQSCARSPIAAFDSIPSRSGFEDVVGIAQLFNDQNEIVGWLYRTKSNRLVVQVTGAMSVADQRKADVQVSATRAAFVSGLKPITAFPWTDVRVLPCAGWRGNL